MLDGITSDGRAFAAFDADVFVLLQWFPGWSEVTVISLSSRRASLCRLHWESLPWANLLERHQTSRHSVWQKFCNLKLVTLLLTFHKEIIFFLEKINSSFPPLQLGAETVVPCIMESKFS